MPLPRANVTVEGGGLGRVALSDDKVGALVLSGVAVASTLDLNTPYQVFTLQEVEALGIDAAYDTSNSTNAHAHCKAFYQEAGNGAELWIIVTANTQTLTQNVGQVAALAQAIGKPFTLGVTRSPDGAYTPTVTNGFDEDVEDAVAAAKTNAPGFANLYQDVKYLIEGRALDDSAFASLPDQRATSNNAGSKYVSVVLGDEASESGNAWVGRVLGVLCRLPVQRSLSRVRNGALNVTNAYLDGKPISEISDTLLGQLYDKGYILPRRHIGKDGIYLAGDPNCDPINSDFAFIKRVRTIEKARRMAHGVLLEEVGEEVPVDPSTGKIKAAYAADLRRKIENALQLGMVDEGEASAVSATVPLDQNILSTDTLSATVQVQPVGTALKINATVNYTLSI